jgi:hypothetical protein
MPEPAKKSQSKNKYWQIPVAVFILFCMAEWLMWIFTPNAFFYPRGRTAPNLNYTSTIHGDLSTDNIFVTPEIRKFHYVTDEYSARNNTTVRQADVITVGQSFSIGGGSSQEFMPANQLAQLTGKVVVTCASRDVWFPGYGQYEVAAFILKFNKPTATKIMIFDVVDSAFSDTLSGKTLVRRIQDVIDNARDYPSLTPMQRFQEFKKYVKDYSPQAIIARKFKTAIKTGFLKFLYRIKLFKRTSRTLDYLDHDGKVYGFPKVSERLVNYSEDDDTFKQIVEAIDLLNRYAREKNILFLVTITPSKAIVYNRYIDTPDKISGYGPAQMFYDQLKERGIQTVMFHKEMFEAVDEEMLHKGPFVYWSDDTHWGPYGIEIGMRQVANKLKELGAVMPSAVITASGITK